ncbi:helix-turn-helix domain-containing protein [Spirosoma sp. HMF4905]|uniref:Helix-turn-helix domain-containing protein n=1 Tax=Spirosoma arboris TaxID=2682092 RepID=A0A7K1SQ99_9BACT|nr:AraC family transcriptional regulator [Spirosoma arboris]MVM35984.1 helix-turn-helix domain-containing protein [Spirosoma arboris]
MVSKNKYEDLWSHHNYIVYVVEGRKIWHTAHGAYDLREGSCVFVRKGACIVEQFFDTEFCFFLFFIPDAFICETLNAKSTPIRSTVRKHEPVMPLANSIAIHTFFQSMLPYVEEECQPDPALLELKFKELILTVADNTANQELLAYFCSLLEEPQSVSLQLIMEANYCYNLKLEEFAALCARSLSGFKRDFKSIYQTTPGKWLLEKRLTHAQHLLANRGKTVGETSFECGFENATHFSRAFRQRFGIAPAFVRQRLLV